MSRRRSLTRRCRRKNYRHSFADSDERLVPLTKEITEHAIAIPTCKPAFVLGQCDCGNNYGRRLSVYPDRKSFAFAKNWRCHHYEPVFTWLSQHGLGAKTAVGYGYFSELNGRLSIVNDQWSIWIQLKRVNPALGECLAGGGRSVESNQTAGIAQF